MTVLRSHWVGRWGEGVHGLRTWDCSTMEAGRQWEPSLAPVTWALRPESRLGLHLWNLFFLQKI